MASTSRYQDFPKSGKVSQPWCICPTARAREEEMPKLDGYLRIKEAAEYLGVSPNTLRNWGRSGKIAERRHPINGYRLYATEELNELLREAEHPSNMIAKRTKPK